MYACACAIIPSACDKNPHANETGLNGERGTCAVSRLRKSAGGTSQQPDHRPPSGLGLADAGHAGSLEDAWVPAKTEQPARLRAGQKGHVFGMGITSMSLTRGRLTCPLPAVPI